MKNKTHIIPAIIAKSQQEFSEKIHKVKDWVDIIQIDVMDGQFVPNTSITFDFILPDSRCKYEAHLMVADPLSWIQHHGHKVDTILVHVESVNNFEEVIDAVRHIKKKIGFVLNPQTSISLVEHYYDVIDEILIMTVNPGFYGSPFLPSTLEKVTTLRNLYPALDIEVDGGITDKTIQDAYQAGANMFVSGSFIIKSDRVPDAIKSLQQKLLK